ncbi:hypothetical protein ACVWZ4_006053 [Bradyrhizobium sp. USDA 4472]
MRFAQEPQKRGIDLVGPFLLHPMTSAVDDQLSREIGQHALQIVDPLGADQAGDDGVLRAGDEQGGLVDLRVLPGRGQLPIAVDVAIPIQPATKPGRAEALGEMSKIGLAQPRRQRLVGCCMAEKALALLDEHRGVRIGKSAAAEHNTHGAGDVTLELGLGDTRRLEILPVEIRYAALAQQLERLTASAERRGHAQPCDGREYIRAEQCRVPGDRRAPVMADDDGFGLAERPDQADDVADQIEDRIGCHLGRRRALAVAPHVGGHDMKPGRC